MSPPSHLVLEEAFPPPLWHALRELIATRGPYRSYVEGPLTEGFGAGLVRRHDALLHAMETQLERGVMESMEEASARGNLFRGVLAGEHTPPDDAVRAIHGHLGLRESAARISGQAHVEPTMLYVNLMLPGQSLYLHSDTPEFVGLSKERAPEWLLVVMHHSGLFEDRRIPIAGGVTFLGGCEGGAFRCWPNGPDGDSVAIEPAPNRAVWLDADRVFHAVDLVGPADGPAPPARPGMTLRPVGDGWLLQDGDRVVMDYPPGAVRVSVQWKARCFESEAACAEARAAPARSVDDIVERLVDDLRGRGVLGTERRDDLDLALTMIRTYIPFPAVG